MTGMHDDTSDVDQTSTKATWRDRVRNAREGKAGMLWKYAPKQLKDEEVSRPGLQTPMLAISVPSSLSNPQFIVLGTSSGFATSAKSSFILPNMLPRRPNCMDASANSIAETGVFYNRHISRIL
jgi:hypothetical protein